MARDVSGHEDLVTASLVQPDGKIVVVGAAAPAAWDPYEHPGNGEDFMLARFTAGGQPDSGFASGGHVLIDGGSTGDSFTGLALQSDGKIVAAGTEVTTEGYRAGIYRFLSTGAPDNGFGTSGRVVIPAAEGGVHPVVAVDPSGRIVVATGGSSENDVTLAIHRYLSNGTPDATFGTGGAVKVMDAAKSRAPRSIAVEPDGQIVLGEVTNTLAQVQRWNADGTFDRTFEAPEQYFLYGVVSVRVGSDGSVVGVGTVSSGNSFPILSRWLANGSLDRSFGASGSWPGTVVLDVTPPPNSSGPQYGRDIALMPDGKIAVAADTAGVAAAVRLLPNGRLDRSFGAAGIATTTLGAGYTDVAGVSLSGSKLVVTGTDDNVATTSDVLLMRVDNTSWTWQPLGGQTTDEPGAVSWAPGRLDVFVRGTDGQLWHRWKDGAGWHGWEPLGGGLLSGPATASWTNGRLDVFVRGTDNQVWHKWYQEGWHGWEPLGGVTNASPSAVSWGNGRIDLFVRGTDGQLWHKWYDGQWRGYEPLGGMLEGKPGASSTGPGRLDIHVLGTDGQLWRRWFDGQWRGYTPMGGGWTGRWSTGPDALGRPGGTDVFSVQSDQIWRGSVINGAPPQYRSIGGDPWSAPSVTSSAPGQEDVFVRGRDTGEVLYTSLPG